jgi:hypothetical protein
LWNCRIGPRRALNLRQSTFVGDKPLPKGATITVDFAYDGGGLGQGR